MLISSLAATTPQSALPIFFGNSAFWKSTMMACASMPRPSKRNAYPRMPTTKASGRPWLRISNAQRSIQIDIGFGDIVTPAPSETGYPTLLEFPGPRLLAYPKETVIAEKFQALVKLGIANTRMKDFYDLEILSRTFAFEGKTLAKAIQNTFQKRGTDLPMGGQPVAFTSEFYNDVNKKRQWTAFCANNKSYVEKTEFKAVIEDIRNFLALPVRTVQEGHSFTKMWEPGGPWR